MDLKTKLAFALVSVSLLSMAALGYLTYRWAEETFLEESERQLAAVVDATEDELASVVADWRRQLSELIARSESLELQGSGAGHGDAPPAEGLLRVLAESLVFSDELRRLALFDTRGEPLSGSEQRRPELADELPHDGIRYAGVVVESDQRLSVVFQAWLGSGAAPLGIVEAAFDGGELARALGPEDGTE